MPITGRLTVRNFSWKLSTRPLHRELPSGGCTDSAGIHDDFILDGTRSVQFGNGPPTAPFRLFFFFFFLHFSPRFDATLILIKRYFDSIREKEMSLFLFAVGEVIRKMGSSVFFSFFFFFFAPWFDATLTLIKRYFDSTREKEMSLFLFAVEMGEAIRKMGSLSFLFFFFIFRRFEF